MKLKTLKDLVMLNMTRFMIKQEAIKWIHELMNSEFRDAPELSRKDNIIGDMASAGWIRNFFNIT